MDTPDKSAPESGDVARLAPAPRPCLILDTNVWMSRDYLALNTPIAASLLFAVRRNGGVLGLPEILEREVELHLAEVAAEAARRYDDALDALDNLDVLSRSDPPFLYDRFSDVGTARLRALQPLCVRSPFTFDQARRALAKVQSSTPPNGPKNQQFKDSAIWEAAIDLAGEYRVIFVTGDKAFFEDREPRKGLAQSLRDEAENTAFGLRVLFTNELPELIQEFGGSALELHERKVMGVLLPAVALEIEPDVRARGFALADVQRKYLHAYVTEHPGTVSIAFHVRIGLSPRTRRNEGASAYVWADGHCSFNIDTVTVDGVKVTSGSIRITRPSGSKSIGIRPISFFNSYEEEPSSRLPRLIIPRTGGDE